MARRPVGLTARTVTLQVRLTKSDAGALDRQRGEQTRSDYVRRLIRGDANHRNEDADADRPY